MKTENFQTAPGKDGGGQAEDGLGKLALAPTRDARIPAQPAFIQASPEQPSLGILTRQVVAYVRERMPSLSPTLIARYFESLATYPLVLLTGSDRTAGINLARLVAEALVGQESCQYAAISGGTWANPTLNTNYEDIHKRFSALRCQNFMQVALEPANQGKAYFASFDTIPFAELVPLIDGCCSVGAQPALALTAVIAPEERAVALARYQDACLLDLGRVRGEASAIMRPAPPVGYQRLWLQARANILCQPATAWAPARAASAAHPTAVAHRLAV